MKSLLLLSLVRAAIYTALLITHNPLPDSSPDTFAVQTQVSRPAIGYLSSWAPDLRSLRP